MRSDTIRTNEELCALYQAGDEEALTLLCEQNKGYIWKIVNEFMRIYPHALAEEGDLVNDGFLGLVTAAARYDTKSENEFLTYADAWIRKYIRADFFQGYDADHPIQSLDEVVGWDKDDGMTSVYERYLADCRWQPEPIVIRKLTNEAVRSAFERIPVREQEYLVRRHGLDGEDPIDRQATADYFGLRERRAELLEKRAYRHMREELWHKEDINRKFRC